MLKDCKSTYTCKIQGCNRKHHTLLHIEKPRQDEEENANTNSHTSERCNKTFLQVLPVKISNGNRMIETNALLDTGSDSTFIRQDIVEKLNLTGANRPLKLSNVMSVSKSINSKLVSFSISSNSHPENVQIENAWVVKDLNLPNSKVSVHEMKDKWPHLRHVDIPEPSNEDNPHRFRFSSFTSSS